MYQKLISEDFGIMKKFIIAMLCVAVLFGFAACDNSSSEPSGDETSSALISETSLSYAADVINGMLEGDTYSVQALIGNEWTADQAVGGKFVASAEDDGDAALKINPTKVTLTIDSVNSKTEGAVTTYNLNKFTYAFSTDTIAADGNHAVLSGTLSGYIAADDIANVSTMAVSTADGKTTVSVDLNTNAKVVMLEKGSLSNVKIGNETADADDVTYLYNVLVSAGTTWGTKVTKYDPYYKDTLLKGQQDAIKAYADALVASTGNVFDTIGKIAVDTELTRDITISEDGKTATVKFTNGGKEAKVVAGADTTALSIPAGESVTFTVTGTTAANAFTMDATSTFTISASAALSTPAADTEITSISLNGVKGTVEGATWAIDAEADTLSVSTLGTVEVTEANYSASNVPVGPAMVDASTETVKGVVAYAPETVTYEIKPATV